MEALIHTRTPLVRKAKRTGGELTPRSMVQALTPFVQQAEPAVGTVLAAPMAAGKGQPPGSTTSDTSALIGLRLPWHARRLGRRHASPSR